MAAGTTQTYLLREFIDEVVRTGGAALAGSGPPPTREQVEAILKQAAVDAAVGLFGDATPIEVELTEELGEIRLFQSLEVGRHVAVDALHAAGYEDVEAGDTLAMRIHYNQDPRDRHAIDKLQRELGAVLPLPVHSDELWVRLTAGINAALLRWFPAPAQVPGSLGALLADGGGWTRGLAVRSGDLEIVLVSAFFDFYRTRVTGGWVVYGFEAAVHRGDVEVFRSREAYVSARLGDDEQAPYLESLCRSDSDGNVRGWTVLPTSDAARPAFAAALQRIVDELAAGGSMNGHVDSERLLSAAIRPPIAGGLWDWLHTALPRLLVGFEHTVPGTHVGFEISQVYPPGIGLSFGGAVVRVLARSGDPDVIPNPDGETLMLGSVGPEALTLRGPDDGECRDLEAIVAKYREWLALHLDNHVACRGIADVGEFNYFYAFDGYFPLVELLEQRIRWGPPGAAPVPPFDEAALERAAKILAPAEAVGKHVLAAFSAMGWTIVLHDDLDGYPFGSYCGISLVLPEGGPPVAVMMVDAWNPETRTVVDGDAFAFRRFATWLRAAVVRGGLDELREFQGGVDEEDDDDDDEEDVDTDDADSALSLSDWLLFRVPDVGDEFLVDWRAQWHIVNAVHRVDDFAGIYGFSGAHVERLLGRDVVAWRRFLREVVDPRFVGSVGEALVNRSAVR